MNTPVKLILGAVATACVAAGVAAQTGTVQLPKDSVTNSKISAPQQAAPAPPTPEPTPTAIASPADAAALAAPLPVSNDEQGEEDGGGHGHGNGHGHKD